MDYYTIAIGLVAGICLGVGTIFFFTGWRRRGQRRLNLLFAVFALSYAGTLMNAIRWYNADSLDTYISINRADTIFVVLAFVALVWYVAEYTNEKPRLFLWGLTALFILFGLANVMRTNLMFAEIIGLFTITLPWSEELAYIEATDSIWSMFFLFGQLSVLVYLVYACVRQYLRGERNRALTLSIGVIWFVGMLVAELFLGEAGVIPSLAYGEFGFLGFVVAVSLQMSNDVIKTEEAVVAQQENLEELVKERTAEFEDTQEKLLQQTLEKATVEERSRLARDLHDAVTQTIYSAALIAEVLPTVWERDAAEGRRNLVKLRQLVRGALAEMRTLLFELRPDSLATADLETLVRQLSDAFTGRTRIPVTIQIEGQATIPAEVKVSFYRFAQEAFNNIEKHARADQVEATLHQGPDQITLAIGDNGQGFDPAKQETGQMGLQIMQERAEKIGADFEVNSRRGEGAEIRVVWVRDEGRKTKDEGVTN